MEKFSYFCQGILVGVLGTLFVKGALGPERGYGNFIPANAAPTVVVDSIVVYDTVFVSRPELRERRVVDTLIVRLPAAETPDTFDVRLERSQCYYTDDSTYRAWVSGYEPVLDSLVMMESQTFTTVDRRLSTSVNRRWGVSVTAGVGVGSDGRVGPSIAVGISYTLFNFR